MSEITRPGVGTHAARPDAFPATQPPSSESPSAQQKAAEVAETGKRAASEVADTATQAAHDVVEQTRQQASDLVGKTRSELGDQAAVQKDSAVSTLRSLADQLTAMTEHADTSGTAVDLAADARDRARNAAEWLEHREPGQVLDELRRVGRDQPVKFLLGALAAGVVAGRLTRGVVAVHSDDAAGSGPESDPARHRSGHDGPADPVRTPVAPSPGRPLAPMPGPASR